jgi:ribosomal protein S18 acetylase RimI-like enzyme
MQTTTESAPSVTIVPLTPEDLDAVVALDRRISGASRRGYFEKRLAAALREPKRHLQLAAKTSEGIVGFMLGRIALGEYGRVGAAGVLEAVGVEPKLKGTGVGRRMMVALEDRLRARDVREIITQVDWRNHPMLKFLDGAGFALAPRHVAVREVRRMPLPKTDEEVEAVPPLVRHLRADDLERIARIDKLRTGQDRSEYLKGKIDEVLRESAIAVSLVVEDDGFVVGFAMARVDFGDFGHVEPAAMLDTLGIDPGFAHKGLARALLGQMVDNLAALHVETLETEVERGSFELLGFLYEFGFGPSQRLAFARRIAPRTPS